MGLGERGQALYDALHASGELDPAREVLCVEACRIADRLEKLDELLRGDVESWVSLWSLKGNDEAVEVVVDKALSEARQQQLALRQLVAALGAESVIEKPRESKKDDLRARRAKRLAG